MSGWEPALAGGRFANRPYDWGVGRTRAGVMRGLLVVEGPPSCALRTGFDRVRANGFGRGACGGEWGMRCGTETPRAAPLPWVPARAGTTMGGVVGCVGARGSGQGGWPVARSRGRAVREPPLRPGWGARGRGCARGLLVVEGPLRVPSGQASTGSGRTGLGGARAVGSGGCDGGCGGSGSGRQQTLLRAYAKNTRPGSLDVRAQGAGRK